MQPKIKRRIHFIYASSWPDVLLDGSVIFRIGKNANNRLGLSTHTVVRAYGHIAVQSTHAHFDSTLTNRPAPTHPAPPCAPTHACRTHVQKRPRSLRRKFSPMSAAHGYFLQEYGCHTAQRLRMQTAIPTNVIGPVPGVKRSDPCAAYRL